MSERIGSVLLLALLAIGAPLHAQERERLLRREARVSARLALLEAKLATSDSLRFGEQRRIVVSAGPFHVAYPEWAAAEAQELLPTLLEERRLRYGVAMDSLLRDTLYIWIGDAEQGGPDGWADLEWRMGDLRGTGSVARSGEMRSDWVTWVPSVALEAWAQSHLDPALVRWLGPANPRPGDTDMRDGTVRELILSASSRGPRCMEGMIDECALLLELAPTADPLLASYDSADYRGMVERASHRRLAGRARCVEGMDPAACARILVQPGHRPAQAAGGGVRQSLLDHALVLGGDVAWLRMSRMKGRPVADQLSAVAGLPIDQLLGEWQRELQEARRTTAAGLGYGFLMVIIWSIVGSLFFAWRYRWRHV
jgi:hypothetical protein